MPDIFNNPWELLKIIMAKTTIDDTAYDALAEPIPGEILIQVGTRLEGVS